MKSWILAVAAGALGLAVGGVLTWSEFAGATSAMPGAARAPRSHQEVGRTEAEQAEFPVVVVEGMPRNEMGYVFDFGAMEMGKSDEITFTLRNEGTAPLTLQQGHFTCTCTLAELSKDVIPPGDSTKVTLRWTPKDVSEMFMTEGEIKTNDPGNPSLRFTLRGQVVRSVRVVPEDLVLDAISASEPHTATFKIYDFHGGEFEVKEYQLEKPETAEFFDITVTPLSAKEVAEEVGARGGLKFAVTLKPGLPLGPINQKIHIDLDREGVETIVMPIRGNVVGDITFIGPGFDKAHTILRLGTISSEEGATRTLHVMVKGPHRHETQLEVEKTSPEDSLQATLGEGRELNQGAVVMIPLEIKVPRGATAGDHLGNQPGTLGRIELKTTNPQAPKVVVYVSFLVEKSK